MVGLVVRRILGFRAEPVGAGPFGQSVVVDMCDLDQRIGENRAKSAIMVFIGMGDDRRVNRQCPGFIFEPPCQEPVKIVVDAGIDQHDAFVSPAFGRDEDGGIALTDIEEYDFKRAVGGGFIGAGEIMQRLTAACSPGDFQPAIAVIVLHDIEKIAPQDLPCLLVQVFFLVEKDFLPLHTQLDETMHDALRNHRLGKYRANRRRDASSPAAAAGPPATSLPLSSAGRRC
jgi:hypothetical protein